MLNKILLFCLFVIGNMLIFSIIGVIITDVIRKIKPKKSKHCKYIVRLENGDIKVMGGDYDE